MVRKLTIVSHASAPSDRSDKLLAANEVIDENHPASDLSIGEDAPAFERSEENSKIC